MRKMMRAALERLRGTDEEAAAAATAALGLMALFTMGWFVGVLITFDPLPYAVVLPLVALLAALAWVVWLVVLAAIDELTRGR